MSEHEQQDPDQDSPRSEGEAHIPIEPHEDPAPKPAINKPSIMDESEDEDLCPACGAKMAGPDAVVCIECGYDLVANKKIKTKFGLPRLASFKGEGDGVFSEPSKLPWQALAIGGLIALGAAAAMAGMNVDAAKIRAVLKVLVYGPLITSIGVGAVIVTAKVVEDEVGRLDFGAARMLLAVGGFALMYQLGQMVETHALVQFLIGAVLGIGVYYLTIWLSFSLDVGVAVLLGGMHFVLWLLFILLMELIGWLEASGGAAG